MNPLTDNQLARQKSPYLQQHKDNPIAWRAWGEAAFAEARAQDKPIFLSIGYSTCHWCHVMAHESFEDLEVAKALNDGFICIKVDREERPDIDDVYMKALQTLTGGGGWPMSIWMTADAKPFFAGTYFAKFRFLQLLRRIDEIWKNQRDGLLQDSERLTAAVKQSESTQAESIGVAKYEDLLGSYISHFQHHFDEKHGGFGRAPKFPQTMNLMMMMRQDYKTGLRQAEVIVNTTLLEMVRGGIYDQLRGGFHRYSVDEKWLVPHFEKMLSDQALISVTLLEASELYGEPELARAAQETLEFVLREMTGEDGGFYSAQDADSLNPSTGKNQEGFYYTYDRADLQSLDSSELALLSEIYDATEAGNYEGRTILHLQEGFDGTAQLRPQVRATLDRLGQLRDAKPRPHLDDKTVASWNGWMVWALIKGSTHFQVPRYLAAAQKTMSFLKRELWRDGSLLRFWRDGAAPTPAGAEDYASLIHACLELYQCDFDPQWAEWAQEMQAVLDQEFFDDSTGLYFANDGRDPLLPLRPTDNYDGVTPSSNSQTAMNLWSFYLLTGEDRYRQRSLGILNNLFMKLKQYPSGLAYLALVMDQVVSNVAVAVISGNDDWVRDLRARKTREIHPYIFWAKANGPWPVSDGKPSTGVSVCFEGKCLAPAGDATTAEEQLRR